MGPMYYIGLDVHKQKISYCVKDSSGKIHAEGWIPATHFDLERWMKTLPQPWSAAMEATMFTGWIYDHLKPHAAALKVAHPLMLRAIVLAKKKNDRVDARKICDCLRCDFLPECYMAATAESIDLLASTGNPPATVDGFDARHHPREIARNRQVAAGQLLQGAQATLAVIHRFHLVAVQQLRQLAGVAPIIPVSVSSQIVLVRIRDQHTRHMRLRQIVQPGRPGPFLQGHEQTATYAAQKLQKPIRLGFENRFHHQLAGRIQNRSRDRCLVHVQANILGIIHKGAPGCRC